MKTKDIKIGQTYLLREQRTHYPAVAKAVVTGIPEAGQVEVRILKNESMEVLKWFSPDTVGFGNATRVRSAEVYAEWTPEWEAQILEVRREREAYAAKREQQRAAQKQWAEKLAAELSALMDKTAVPTREEGNTYQIILTLSQAEQLVELVGLLKGE